MDVFEHLDRSETDLDLLRLRLGPSARALYDRWIG
jgi:hypothetical protein